MSRVRGLWLRYQWPLGVFVVGRVGLFVLAYMGLVFVRQYDPRTPDAWELFGENAWLNGWARWDAGWYRVIAELGYLDIAIVGEQRNFAFFPLYPLLIRIARWLIPDTGVAGLLISNLALALALILLYQLVLDRFGTTPTGIALAQTTTLLAVVYPFSFYYSALYPESLFFLLMVAAFFCAERGRWGWAALLAALSGATRLQGVTLGVGLLVLYLEQIEFQWRRIRPNILWLALVPVGLVAYVTYLGLRFGDPMLLVTARQVSGWGMEVDFWKTIREVLSVEAVLTGKFDLMNLFNLTIGVASLFCVLIAWRRLPLAYVVWTVAYFVVSAIGNWFNLGRYMLPVFPVFLGLAFYLQRKEAVLAVVYLSSLILALLTFLYSHWYWIS